MSRQILSCLFILGQASLHKYEFFGFSDDLRYVAFERYEVISSDGTPDESSIYFIDVAKNDYAVRPSYRKTDVDPNSSSDSLNVLRRLIQSLSPEVSGLDIIFLSRSLIFPYLCKNHFP